MSTSMTPGPRRRGKEIPRLPLSAFASPATGPSDTFPLPPTPSLVTPTAVADAHLQLAPSADVRAVVLSPSGHSHRSLPSLQSAAVDARVLAVLVPFALESADIPQPTPPTDALPLALASTYDGATPVAAEGDEDAEDQARAETPVTNLRWALQHARVVDLNIEGGVVASNTSSYDSLVNLLTKVCKSGANPKHTPIVLTSVLPPPLDAIIPVVALMNHPIYTTYRQRVSLISLFENVHVKLLPPNWVSSAARLEETEEKELRNILKLFIVPVLEAFGFDRIIFGSSPASASGSPVLAENWYKLVLESFRELAVSQDEMDKIFIENAERVYGAT